MPRQSSTGLLLGAFAFGAIVILGFFFSLGRISIVLGDESAAAWAGAFGTLVAIVAAIGIALAQWAASLRSQRASLAPALVFEVDCQERRARIVVHNHGMGPALIRKFVATVDGNAVVASPVTLPPTIATILNIPRGIAWGHIPGPGVAVRHGGELVLLNLDLESSMDTQALEAELQRVDFVVTVESLADELFQFRMRE